MKLYQILLASIVVVSTLAVAVRHDIDVVNSKNGLRQVEFQSTKPTTVETPSTRDFQDDLRVAQLKLQANQIEGSSAHVDKLAHEAQFYSQDIHATGSTLSHEIIRNQNRQHNQEKGLSLTTESAIQSSTQGNLDISLQHQLNKQGIEASDRNQFYSSNQQPSFYNDKYDVPQDRDFYEPRQQMPNQQGFYNVDQQSVDRHQQQYFDDRQQGHDQQQFFNYNQQRGMRDQFHNDNQNQRQIYNVQAIGVSDQHIKANGEFQDVVARRTQVGSGVPLTQIQSRGIKTALQLSAFNTREHPIVLPKSTSMHTSSVVVSGLKNLPILPAMVYNTGSIPSTHAIAIGRESVYKGSASLRQHMQTPYVRYVYSHLL